jgi:hypothetical protein
MTAPRQGLAAAIGISFISLALGCAPVRYTEAFSPDVPVLRVELDVDKGSVVLSPGDSVRVERAVRGADGAVELSHTVDPDGTLRIEARCPGFWPCGVDTRLTLPPELPVHVTLGSGDLWATGLEDLRLDIARGEANVEVQRRLVAMVGTGNVRAWLASETDASIAVGRGDVTVVVPPGPYALDLSARRRVVSNVDPDADARGQLLVVAPSGSVEVSGGQRVASR